MAKVNLLMIRSQYITDILDLLLDGDDGSIFRKQLPFLTDAGYEYTGAGLFVSFSYAGKIDVSLPDELILSGVEIESPEAKISADAMVRISNHIVDYLEIWSHTGDYPDYTPVKYTLTQDWSGSPGRKIIR